MLPIYGNNFSEKSIFKFITNSDLLNKNQKELSKKKMTEQDLSNFINRFKDNKESRKLVVKEKLFYKEKGEK